MKKEYRNAAIVWLGWVILVCLFNTYIKDDNTRLLLGIIVGIPYIWILFFWGFPIKEQPFNTSTSSKTNLCRQDQLRLMLCLETISRHGGTTTAEGLHCTGSWCAEQAAIALKKVKES